MALVELDVDDVDLMEEIINSSPASGRRGYDATYVQLSKGRFGGHHVGTRPTDDPLLEGLTGFKSPDSEPGTHGSLIVASRQHYGARLHIRGTSPPDRTGYYLVARSTRLLRARGVVLRPGDLIEVPPASAMDFVTEQMTIVTFSFENAILDSICRATGHRPDAQALSLPPRLTDALSATVLAYLRAHETGVPDPGFTQSIEDRFAAAVSSAQPVRPRRVSAALRLRALRIAQDWLHEHLREPVPAHFLAELAGVPLRTLQHAFSHEIGVSPHVYHARLRLRAARAFLVKHTPESASVVLAARSHGFAHLGRFAEQYRSMFGESPSETLARERRAGVGHGIRP